MGRVSKGSNSLYTDTVHFCYYLTLNKRVTHSHSTVWPFRKKKNKNKKDLILTVLCQPINYVLVFA